MSDKTENRTAMLIVRLRPSLKAVAERVAHDDGRSLSALVEKLLTEHAREEGYLTSS